MTDTDIANDAEIATDETDALIASNKVEGTAVYSEEGEKLGSIYNFMVDKISGQVEYAVLQFGGVFGLGSDYYPLPWDSSPTTPNRAAMSSMSTRRRSKARRAIRPRSSRPMTTPMASGSTPITA